MVDQTFSHSRETHKLKTVSPQQFGTYIPYSLLCDPQTQKAGTLSNFELAANKYMLSLL
jgi:hypothetical protein